MTEKGKQVSSGLAQLSNPASTGGRGGHFEAHVQASFVTLMLTGGCAPCFPGWPIREIKLQGKVDGYDTDDLIVFLERTGGDGRKLLAQIKQAPRITKDNRLFREIIQRAWTDFNKPSLFTQRKDVIAAMTGPLSYTDTQDACWLLDYARCTKDEGEFFRNVAKAKFSSTAKQKKLGAFRHQLRLANDGKALSPCQVHDFLCCFHLLGYDLGRETGVALALLHSHISQFDAGAPQMVWGRIVDVVQTWNQNAGTITRGNLPEDLLNLFRKRVTSTIPAEIIRGGATSPASAIPAMGYGRSLSQAFLLGGWDEACEGDRALVARLAGETYEEWIPAVREALESPAKPIGLRNGVWAAKSDRELWEALARKLFDADLDALKAAAVAVLREPNPSFELPAEERYLANIMGKVPSHSHALRKGLADALAVMGSMPGVFANCSDGRSETVAALVVRHVLDEADWMLWGSLNNLLPLLAEAAPGEFLSAVENAMGREPCPFSALFAEEGSGMMGSNYLTGLLWALESLAWDKEHLTRVTVVFGELAEIDPGGNWANRPANSLTTIFLPWLPQTTASKERRLVAVRTLVREAPKSAWRLLLGLLPDQHQTSMGSHKPRWRMTLPEDNDGVTQQEYWDQVSNYADITVGIAEGDIERLAVLVRHLDHLPAVARDSFLDHLASPTITDLPEEKRTELWSALQGFVARHRRYADAEWSLDEEPLARIERVSLLLAPEAPRNRYRRIFGARDHDLYEEHGDWREEERKLRARREAAIKEILSFGDVHDVVEFAGMVESPTQVGTAFGAIADDGHDRSLLPALFGDESEPVVQFIASYVRARHWKEGWKWVDAVLFEDWDVTQLGCFLRSLPFCPETWTRASQLLGGHESAYWESVGVNPYQADTGLEIAIDKLLEHGRSNAAIDCVSVSLHKENPLDHVRAVRALLAAATTKEPAQSMDVHNAVEVIKALQDDDGVDGDDLFQVEWAYLGALDGHWGTRPKLLEQRLASDSAFFCELIRLAFCSRDDEGEKKEPTEQEQRVAHQAYRLLHEWQTPPGTLAEGGFCADAFHEWLAAVRTSCEETGHLEVALSQLGEALIHAPADPRGLWIDESVASALNARDSEEMRSGFRTGIYNSRGAHCVDPTGKPEKELAAKYRAQADDAETTGFHRLATTMRKLSDSYLRDVERIIAKYGAKSDED
ncbi:MAG: hypothetical protein HN742_21610 [Lentisphaerae bacterium]|jgi:hypothetical protein|nr:hypothetical protein [Lentisphaerota bacterium]MBT4822706.1 hypothetical protein [Lentisphaerota bacterium]MBT5608332.1 hypothetical protein [Lentisphaerota bacterium]MBT7057473.1 hypothetical protein [Lentisphaerota bacterium]MBT7844489.1 hypothetical protein [Lentisphaerota bacterium]